MLALLLELLLLLLMLPLVRIWECSSAMSVTSTLVSSVAGNTSSRSAEGLIARCFFGFDKGDYLVDDFGVQIGDR